MVIPKTLVIIIKHLIHVVLLNPKHDVAFRARVRAVLSDRYAARAPHAAGTAALTAAFSADAEHVVPPAGNGGVVDCGRYIFVALGTVALGRTFGGVDLCLVVLGMIGGGISSLGIGMNSGSFS